MSDAEICMACTWNCVNFADLVTIWLAGVAAKHLFKLMHLEIHIRLVDFSLNTRAVEQELM